MSKTVINFEREREQHACENEMTCGIVKGIRFKVIYTETIMLIYLYNFL